MGDEGWLRGKLADGPFWPIESRTKGVNGQKKGECMSSENDVTLHSDQPTMPRRSFLKWAGALGGAAAVAGGVPHGFVAQEALAEEAAESAGTWIPAACWSDCGSKGFNKVLVVDGVPVRGGTDDATEDSPDHPQLRSCARGRALRDRLLGPDRLKYPMKRKHWESGGGDKSLRGRDEWVRISWEEALDIVASEIKRIVEKYGNTAIYGGGIYCEVERTMNLYGGFVDDWASCSSGTWTATGPAIGLPRSRGNTGEDTNDHVDLRNSQLIVLWGYNPAWSRAGVPAYNLLQCKKAGAKFICVDPFFNATAVAMEVAEDDWIPCRPATDHALALGIMHTLLEEDDPESNPLIRWDYLEKYTVGFDAEHMPEGADPKDNFKDYLLGIYDGQPKSAEWASEICGVRPDKIRSLAREIATTERVAIIMSPAPARVNDAQQFPQAMITLGFMTGHVGTPGNMVNSDTGHAWLCEGPELVTGGTWIGRPSNFPGTEPINNPIQDIQINRNEVWDAIINGKYTAGKDDVRDIDIEMIYLGKAARLIQMPGTVKGIEAFRKVEFVVVQDQFLTSQAQFADVVLPITSFWERCGTLTPSYRERLTWSSKVVDPLFESKDDIWVAVELAKRLGVDPELVQPISPEQDIFNQVAAATVIKEDGSGYEPLVTITEQDISDFGVEGTPQQGRIGIKEFKESGIYQVPRVEGDKFGYIFLEDFIKDPEANPLETPSGKIEIHCQTLADNIEKVGFSSISPIPKYARVTEGYEDTFSDWDNKVKGDFPLQLYSLHVLRRAHSSFDNSPWLREAFPNPLYMNPMDADERSLKNGDTILIESPHGKVLRTVNITENIRPGVVAMGQGQWLDWDDELGLDRGGCINVLNGAIATGEGHQGWNSCIVQVTKWDGDPLPADVDVPQRIVEFAE